MHIRYLTVCLALFLFVPFHTSASNPQDSTRTIHTEWIPTQKLLPVYTADGRAHRLSVQYTIGSNAFIGSMGGIFPVVSLKRGEQALQFSVASTLYTTLKRSITHGELINTDFFVDLFLDLKMNEHFILRTGAGHTSQHLSDDAVAVYPNINYARDYIDLFLNYTIPDHNAIIYSGVYYNHNFKTTDSTTAYDISGTPIFQVGFEHAPWRISNNGRFFYAADVKLHGEFDYATTQHYQLGLRFENENKKYIRIAANYTYGYEERGQFFRSKHNFYTVGFYFDF